MLILEQEKKPQNWIRKNVFNWNAYESYVDNSYVDISVFFIFAPHICMSQSHKHGGTYMDVNLIYTVQHKKTEV